MYNNVVTTATDLTKPYLDKATSSAVDTATQIFNDSLKENEYVNPAIAFAGGVIIGKMIGQANQPTFKQLAMTTAAYAAMIFALCNGLGTNLTTEKGEIDATFMTSSAAVVGVISGMLISPMLR